MEGMPSGGGPFLIPIRFGRQKWAGIKVVRQTAQRERCFWFRCPEIRCSKKSAHKLSLRDVNGTKAPSMAPLYLAQPSVAGRYWLSGRFLRTSNLFP